MLWAVSSPLEFYFGGDSIECLWVCHLQLTLQEWDFKHDGDL